jgi:hypothetical protein
MKTVGQIYSPGVLTPGERVHGTHWTGVELGHRLGLAVRGNEGGERSVSCSGRIDLLFWVFYGSPQPFKLIIRSFCILSYSLFTINLPTDAIYMFVLKVSSVKS